MLNFGIIGVGYWGPNLARNLNSIEGGRLAWVCDANDKTLARVASNYPGARMTSNVQDLLGAGDLDAIVIATPAATHFELTKACLQAGKHVLVEKPLAGSSVECDQLIEIAEKANLRLMVGHTFLYSPPVVKIRQLLDDGELGDVYYGYSTRVNLGQVRRDVDALWNLAPHDISIFLYLFNAFPNAVSAKGITRIQENIADVVFLNMDFPDNVSAHVHVSWLDPGKVRTVTLVGSKKMVIYDDVSADAKIQILDKGVTKIQSGAQPVSEFGEYQLTLRAGDVLIPKIPTTEPLRVECQHFADCIANSARPLTDGVHGRQVVRILEAASESMAKGSCPVEVML